MDAVLISFDLEVASDRQKLETSAEDLIITQIGFASLDTRDIDVLSSSSDLSRLISVAMYVVKSKAKSKKAARKQERECIFAPARSILQDQVVATIARHLRIPDDLRRGQAEDNLRAVVLVGNSIGEDLRFLRCLGMDIAAFAPMRLIVVDTHTVARFVLPPYHPNLRVPPGHSFSLAGILAQLGYHPRLDVFHNAGNDAVYSLYATLLLVVERGAARELELGITERIRLQYIRRAVSKVLEQSFAIESPDAQPLYPPVMIMLGAGLREIASALVPRPAEP
ncbi:hypothetical protein SAMD00023353_5200200 [Rosellinia necatrix]|uniref:Gfd2/YDR514C-like C-terminal domain-containing protein n=1 Tax=Rosellinia necatrix TaxID=77044 RepID=A0A1W2TQI1_ROSNE|nr:hypothetical protein SAMD00023353_5200200 [Rosellinia necatrix]